jgi:hypothetical protein
VPRVFGANVPADQSEQLVPSPPATQNQGSAFRTSRIVDAEAALADNKSAIGVMLSRWVVHFVFATA